jgi:hypothetical protein
MGSPDSQQFEDVEDAVHLLQKATSITADGSVPKPGESERQMEYLDCIPTMAWNLSLLYRDMGAVQLAQDCWETMARRSERTPVYNSC